MGQSMKISSRIWLGFGSVLGICALLGATAVTSMSIVRSDAAKLESEYVPEVAVANEIERGALQTMYAIRGYTFAYDPEFLSAGKQDLADLSTQIAQAESLAQKSVHLVKLKEHVVQAQTAVVEYAELLQKSQKEIDDIVESQGELDTHAAAFVTQTDLYLKGQHQKMENEIRENAGRAKLSERFKKIAFMNKVRQYGNSARIAIQKSQALRDFKIAESALPNFDNIEKIIADAIPITHTPEFMKQLEAIRNSVRGYKKETLDILTAWKNLNEISVKRGKAGEKVTEAAQATATAGIKETVSISDSTVKTLNAVALILIIGLAGALVLGGIVAFSVSQTISNALSRISTTLGLSSRQVRDAAAQMSSASQQLASSSAEQASSIEETTASVEQMNGMIANNVENASRAAVLSEKVSTITEHGNKTMKKMELSMNEILASNTQIEQLVKVIAAIDDKTKVMDEIVFQTKLLSFNASVEAERAGEHGRGFAVVAQEVGNLAQMSGKAANEIAQILLQSVAAAEKITGDNKRKVEGGSRLVSETAAALQEILESANAVNSGATQVLGASKEQASGIKQIGSAMNTLEKATQQNSALAEEVASTSEEMASQCHGLDTIVAELTKLVHGNDKLAAA